MASHDRKNRSVLFSMNINNSARLYVSGLMYLTAVTLLSTWLPFIRGLFDGRAYVWGNTYFGFSFSGRGIQGDYWFILLKLSLGIGLFYAAFQVPQRGWFYGLLVGWYGLLIVSNLYEIMQNPDAFTLRGDTLGLEIPLHVPFGLFVLLVGWLIGQVIIRENHETTSAPTGVNQRWLVGLLSLLPIQGLVLSLGQEDWLDVLGVLITISQCLLIPKVFMSKN